MWFNPGELLKDKIIPLANSANSANYEPESHNKTPLISKLAKLAELAAVEWLELPEPANDALMVTCYTPAGNAVEVEAKNPAHADFLQRMNPKPKLH
jgi:hypothetical protein